VQYILICGVDGLNGIPGAIEAVFSVTVCRRQTGEWLSDGWCLPEVRVAVGDDRLPGVLR
jgi:hypothetical protein